jgi:hypothetical protein
MTSVSMRPTHLDSGTATPHLIHGKTSGGYLALCAEVATGDGGRLTPAPGARNLWSGRVLLLLLS